MRIIDTVARMGVSLFWLGLLYGVQLYVAVGALGISEISEHLGDQAVYVFQAVKVGDALRERERAKVKEDEAELDSLADDLDKATEAFRAMGIGVGLPLEKIQPLIDNYDQAPRLASLLGRSVDDKTEHDWADKMAAVMSIQAKRKGVQTDLDQNIALLRQGWAKEVAQSMDGSHKISDADIEVAAGTAVTLRRLGYAGLFTLPKEILTLVLALTMGALGSTLHVTKSLLEEDDKKKPSYYLIRPFQGMLTALVMYVLLKAGQVTISSSNGSDLNNFFVSFAGIVSGLMSTEAYRMIENAGARLVAANDEDARWAFRLKDALAGASVDVASLAAGIGVSVADLTAWVNEAKPVPALEQRLIASWLRCSPRDLFTSQPPAAMGENPGAASQQPPQSQAEPVAATP